MDKKEDKIYKIEHRSPLFVSINTRLLGISVTVFILILTIKSELLASPLITTQLVLSIPLFMRALWADAKIRDAVSLEKFRSFTRSQGL